MATREASKSVFLASGIYALLCAPLLLVAERFSFPQWPLHASQFIAVLICLPASLIYLWCTRGQRAPIRQLAIAASLLAASWLGFIAYIVGTIDFGAD